MENAVSKRRRVRHRLTQRDFAILKYIDENEHLNREHIREKFWPGKDNNHHHRRLRILMELNTVREGHKWGAWWRSFTLTKSGETKLANFLRQRSRKLASSEEE